MSKCTRKRKFSDKFCILSSQESVEDKIHWSSSDSDDTDLKKRISTLFTNKTRFIKRKRKHKIQKTDSNLEVLVIDQIKHPKKTSILEKNLLAPEVNKGTRTLKSYEDSLSPVKKENISNCLQKSPILSYSVNTPKLREKTKIQLFSYTENTRERSSSPVLVNHNYNNNNKIIKPINEIGENLVEIENFKNSKENVSKKKDENMYFTSHFSSESISQHTINNTPSQEINSQRINSDLDISTSLIENSSKTSNDSVKPQVSSNNTLKEFLNDCKYKKGGLMYRLDMLLNKKESNILLWEHERYMALKTNFIVPKTDYAMFQIKQCIHNFGCHLLVTRKIESNECYLIVINDCYVRDAKFDENSFLKLFEPYQLLQMDDYKIILDASKYICINFN